MNLVSEQQYELLVPVLGTIERIPFKVVVCQAPGQPRRRYAVVDGWWNHVDHYEIYKALQSSFNHGGQVIIDEQVRKDLKKIARHRMPGITLQLFV